MHCSLLYHIVADDVMATEILAEFNRQQLRGELNFFALSRLNAHARECPQLQVHLCTIINIIVYIIVLCCCCCTGCKANGVSD